MYEFLEKKNFGKIPMGEGEFLERESPMKIDTKGYFRNLSKNYDFYIYGVN